MFGTLVLRTRAQTEMYPLCFALVIILKFCPCRDRIIIFCPSAVGCKAHYINLAIFRFRVDLWIVDLYLLYILLYYLLLYSSVYNSMLYIIIHAQPITCSTYYNSFKIITYGQIILSYYIMWLYAADIIVQCTHITILGLIVYTAQL